MLKLKPESIILKNPQREKDKKKSYKQNIWIMWS